jgi:hypothetical protein
MNDSDAECPIGQSGDSREKIVSFGHRHSNYANPNDYLDRTNDGKAIFKLGIRRQLATSCAFVLSYHEHGSCVWSLMGEGPQCQWDTVQFAGIYWVPTDVPQDERRTYAKAALREYTDWCNGACYGYSIETEDGETVDSCFGYIGDEYLMTEVKKALESYMKDHEVADVVITGEAAWLANYHELPKANAA